VLISNIFKRVHDQAAADVMGAAGESSPGAPRGKNVETPMRGFVRHGACMDRGGRQERSGNRFIHVKDVLGPVAERRETKRPPIPPKSSTTMAIWVAPWRIWTEQVEDGTDGATNSHFAQDFGASFVSRRSATGPNTS